LQVTDEVIAWLARDPGGARPILGNIALLEVLGKRFRPPLTMKVVETELAGSKSPRPGVLDELLAAVSHRFQVSVKALLGPSRVRDIVLPRQIAMYIARSVGFSFPEIAAFFGGRDHTTVMHACEKLAALIETDATLANHVRELQTMTSFRASSS
jgi:chromosomal replication initiator protein